MTEVVAGFEGCPSWAPAFGYLGASSCMILASWGSAWGTWRAGLGVCHMGIDHPAGIIKNIVPIVMAGVLGIYGLIVSVIIIQAVTPPNSDHTNVYSSFNGYTHVRTVPETGNVSTTRNGPIPSLFRNF
jgi:V-type H+-transporting ATPase proteolipid subunit